MDYVVEVNGVKIVIEHEEPRDNRNRLLEYYKNLLSGKGIDNDPAKKKALEKIVNEMTEEAAAQKLSAAESGFAARVTAYHNAIQEKLTEKEAQIADALEEVVEAAMEDDDQDSIMVNGNKFLFDKNNINIELYLEKLNEVGERQKGNTWTVYLDDEGEVVIY